TDESDFIELVVVGDQTVELSAYTLELIDGTTGQPYGVYALSDAADQLHPGERMVLGPESVVTPLATQVATLLTAGDFLANGGVDGNAIRLVRSTVGGSEIIDAVAYEHAVPGANEGDSHVGFESQFGAGDTSFCRCPDSVDTNVNSFDFQLHAPTPGDANVCDDGEEE
ncbi:MAG: hypothetical protein QF464_15545, partial [Myxococcota bacterium]|nr:hypothetical protein [Myxococcota bacterium]